VTSSQSLLLLIALLGAGAALSQARAAPLDADTCAKLTVEHGTLEKGGVEANMAKGPEWGKANLTPEKIEEVRRFIELEELILFRCRSKSRVALPPDPEEKDQSKEKDQGKDQAKDQTKVGEDKGEPGKDAAVSTHAKGPGPATKAKADATVQPKAPPKKQASPQPKAKSAAQQPPKKPAPKAKAEEDDDDPEADGNPFGAPFEGAPK
jgi:hypothetical protein